MTVIAVLLSLASLVAAPTVAAKVLGLPGGVARGALVGLVTLGLMQIIGLFAQFLGPLGDTLALMGFLAAWFQVVKVVHGTDPARTLVFMFWHLFFLLLAISLMAVLIGAGSFSWWWRG